MTISNDKDFRSVLDGLSESERRIVAGRFVKNVMHLSRDPLAEKALEITQKSERSAQELEQAYRSARSYAATSFTECGSDTDWMSQADHFVATALAASLLPTGTIAKGKNLAWQAALEARMAKNCELLERDDAEEHNESQRQYEILEEFRTAGR